MKTNKKIIIIAIVVMAIIAVICTIYKVRSSYMFDENNRIPKDGKKQLVEMIKGIEDTSERKRQIDICVDANIITQKEANKLY